MTRFFLNDDETLQLVDLYSAQAKIYNCMCGMNDPTQLGEPLTPEFLSMLRAREYLQEQAYEILEEK